MDMSELSSLSLSFFLQRAVILTTQGIVNLTWEIIYVKMPRKKRERRLTRTWGFMLAASFQKRGCGRGRNICCPGPLTKPLYSDEAQPTDKVPVGSLWVIHRVLFLSHRNIYISISIYNIFLFLPPWDAVMAIECLLFRHSFSLWRNPQKKEKNADKPSKPWFTGTISEKQVDNIRVHHPIIFLKHPLVPGPSQMTQCLERLQTILKENGLSCWLPRNKLTLFRTP